MKYLTIVVALIVFLTACGTVNDPSIQSNQNVVADIIEENKDDLNYIKNRTADDLELGAAVRNMIVKNRLSDTAIGSSARQIVLNQKTTPMEVQERHDKERRAEKIIFIVLFAVCIFILAYVIIKKVNKNG
jgi:hypothetical protein